MFSSTAVNLLQKYATESNKLAKTKKDAKRIKKDNSTIETSLLSKQVYIGKKLNKKGLGQDIDDDLDFLNAAIDKQSSSSLYGKFVKSSKKLQTVVSMDKMEEFQYIGGKGGISRNSAKLRRMEALYSKDKESNLKKETQ